MLGIFGSPERYVQGKDATTQLGAQMTHLGLAGCRILIVAGRSARAQLSDIWATTLGSAGFEYDVHPFGGECTYKEIESIAEIAKQRGSKTLIAAGGGKCIDAVRAACNNLDLPFISCPTVASTDAPCSALSAIYDDSHTFAAIQFVKRHPLLVLVDTTVISKSPKKTLVGGLGDALGTWFEARTVREANISLNFLNGRPLMAGTSLAELCFNILLEDGVAAVHAIETQSITPAFERIVEANTLLSGLGFESGGLCTAHSVNNGLTVCPCCHDYTHGDRVAFGTHTQLVLESRPQEEINTVKTWCEAVGLPITLSDLGVDAGDDDLIKAIALRSVAEGETVHNSPFIVTDKSIIDAMKTADHAGHRYREKIGAGLV